MKLTVYSDEHSPLGRVVSPSDEKAARALTTFRTGGKSQTLVSPAAVSPCPGGKCRNAGTGRPDCGGTQPHRMGANAVEVHALVLDFDSKPEKNLTLTTAALKAAVAKLKPYQFAFHTTHSSAPPDYWRARVWLWLSRPVLASEWARFYPAALQSLGLAGHPNLDPSCKDPSRGYFAPTEPTAGSGRSKFNPGAPLDVDAILAAPAPTAVAPPATLPAAANGLPASLGPKGMANPEGGQDNVLNRLCSSLAFSNPGATAADLLGRLWPTLAATDWGEGIQHLAVEATKKLERHLERAQKQASQVPTPEALQDAMLPPTPLPEEPFEKSKIRERARHLHRQAEGETKTALKALLSGGALPSVEALDAALTYFAERAPRTPLAGIQDFAWASAQTMGLESERVGQALRKIAARRAEAEADDDSERTKKPFDAEVVEYIEGRYVWVDRNGAQDVFRREGNALTPVKGEGLTDLYRDVIAFVQRRDGYEPGYLSNVVRGSIGQWLKTAEPFTHEIQAFAFEGEPGFTTHVLPKPVEGPTPAWDQFLSRLSDETAFLCWLGEMFTPGSLSRSLLWLEGDGSDGKSRVAKAIAKFLGPASFALPTHIDSEYRHLTDGIQHARLVLQSDCKQLKILSTALIRSITGGDMLRIEPKGRPAYQVDASGLRVWINSNDPPEIGNRTADRSRLLHIEVRPRKKPADDTDWDAAIQQEMPALVAKARAAYEAAGRKIPRNEASEELLDAATESGEANTDVLMDRWVVLDPKGVITNADFVAVAKRDNLSETDKAAFRRRLKSAFGATRRIRVNGKQSRVWVGARMLKVPSVDILAEHVIDQSAPDYVQPIAQA